MILVDTSVWIAYLRNDQTEAVDRLWAYTFTQDIIAGDLILLEVLQGTRDDGHARHVRQQLEAFPTVNLLDEKIAIRAAENYRTLRARGRTISKITDLIIGTFCIERGHRLLHSDRDFTPMVEHLGLQLA